MSLWKIAWRSIQQRALASTLTAISMGLSVALVVIVLVVSGVVHQNFRRGGEGYDLIVGAKGDELQLVLNTAFYLSDPIENIPYSLYWNLTDGRYATKVEVAVPICMGHRYKSYRVVGTTPAMFDDLTHRDNRPYTFAPGGRNFKDDEYLAAVVGSVVARKERLKVGSRFKATHGTVEHGQEFEIVGILEHTGTPNDKALFVHMEGFFQMHDQEHGHDGGHDEADGDGEHEHSEDGHDDHGHAEAVHTQGEEEVGAAESADCALSGFVYADTNGNGIKEPAERPIGGVRVRLRGQYGEEGEDDLLRSTLTDAEGAYHFDRLPPGTYTLTEAQPNDYLDGAETLGNAGGEVGKDKFSAIRLSAEQHGTDYNFGNDLQVTAVLVRVNTEYDPGMMSLGADPADESSDTVGLASPDVIRNLTTEINRGPVAAQAVGPVRIISDFLRDTVGDLQLVMLVMTVVIVMVAGIGIMVSIYNSMSDRRHEIAVMRALGAGRRTIMLIVLLESILLSLGGGVLGLLLGHGLIGIFSSTILERTNVAVGMFDFQVAELILIPALVVLASAVGYLPAVAAYRTDVAQSLTNTP